MHHGIDLTPIAIVLSLAFVSAFVFRRLHQPLLVGYILVGVLLGPLFLHNDAGSAISVIAELGVLLLMFMIGLELDFRRFKKLFRPAIVVVVLQILAGCLLMLLFAYVQGMSLAQAVVLGFVVSLSSTAVAIGTLRDLRQENTEAGQTTTAVLIAQDLAVVPMLLVVGVLGYGTLEFEALVQTGVALVLVVCTLVGIFYLVENPRIMRRITRFLDTTIEQPVIAGAALCFTAAAVSGVVGLSTAYGAFAAGLLLGNMGELSEKLENAVKPLYDLLIMIFFLSVGLIIDVGYIVDNIWSVGMLLGVVLVFKTLINYGIIELIGLTKRGTSVAAASLGQVGEFSFILAGVALGYGILDNEVYQMVLVVIALSLILSPVWVRIVQYRFGIPSLRDYVRNNDKFQKQKDAIRQRLGL